MSFSHRKRELVEDEEVGVVFGFHQATEKLFTDITGWVSVGFEKCKHQE